MSKIPQPFLVSWLFSGRTEFIRVVHTKRDAVIGFAQDASIPVSPNYGIDDTFWNKIEDRTGTEETKACVFEIDASDGSPQARIENPMIGPDELNRASINARLAANGEQSIVLLLLDKGHTQTVAAFGSSSAAAAELVSQLNIPSPPRNDFADAVKAACSEAGWRLSIIEVNPSRLEFIRLSPSALVYDLASAV